MDNPIQWVSALTESCIQTISDKNDIKYEVEDYRKAYYNFTDQDKYVTHQILLSQFEVEDSVWILS